MKTIKAAASLFILSSVSALAADLPSIKSAPVAPAPSWTGYYVGLNIGYNFGNNGPVNVAAINAPWIFGSGASLGAGAPIAPNTLNSSYIAGYSYSGSTINTQSGVIGGGQLGYNYQFDPKYVAGFEIDFQGAGINGGSTIQGGSYGVQPYQGPGNSNPVAGAITTAMGSSQIQSGVNWLGTARGRLGFLWSPALLLYGTGGFAYGGAYANVSQNANEYVLHQQNISVSPAVPTPPFVNPGQNLWFGNTNQSQVLVGWTAGAGAEWKFMTNWSVKAEALYWDLGRMNVNTSTYGTTVYVPTNAPAPWFWNNNFGWGKTSVQYSGIIARAGVNYHFNFESAPIVAKF
jgi:outer membrane immunogenic protein